MRSLTKAAAVGALAVTVCGAWPATAGADPDPPPAPKTTIDADGTYAVGTQIAPGSYSTAGPVGDGACSFKVVNGGDSPPDIVFTKKPQVVTIGADAKSFKTDGCQPWQPADCSAGCAGPVGSPGQVLGQLGSFLLPRIGSTGPAAPSGSPNPATPPG
jgi:hypothetical protein